MTPVFCCGFECGQLGSVGQHWSIGAGSPAISTTTVKSGSRSLRFNPSAASAWVNHTGLAASSNIWVGRVYMRFATLPNSTVNLIYNNADGVFFNSSDNKIYAGYFDGSNHLGATGVSVTTGQWYRIDFKFNASNNPHLTDVSVDGTACGQASNATAAASISQLTIGNITANTTMDMFVDDVVFSHTSGDFPIGAGFVNHFIPTSDGTHNTGTAGTFITGAAGANITNATTTSFQLVDEVPLDDTTPDTNDYINQAGNGTGNYVENVFGPASGISTPTYAPRAVEVIVGYHQAATTSGSSTFKVNDNGTEDTIVALSGNGVTTTRYSRKHYALAPTGGAWTISGAGNFNNLRHRFGYSGDANPDQYFDCAMVEAEFDANPPAAPTVKPFALMGVG